MKLRAAALAAAALLAATAAGAAPSKGAKPAVSEAWLAEMSGRLERYAPKAFDTPAARRAFLTTLHEEAARAGLAPEIVLAVVDVESRFERFAISPSGAQGYMQVMPVWLKVHRMPNANLFHTRTNLRLGCDILRAELRKAHGDRARALAGYNGSSSDTRYADKVLGALRAHWRRA